MIKHKLLLIAVLGASILMPAAVQAQGISIQIGDRPYYSHGPRYWAGDYEMIWVPGHRSGHHWVHGHYVRGHHRHHYNNNRYNDGRYRQDVEVRDSYRH